MLNIERTIQDSVRDLEHSQRTLAEIDTTLHEVLQALDNVMNGGSLDEIVSTIHDAIASLDQVAAATEDFTRNTNHISSTLQDLIR